MEIVVLRETGWTHDQYLDTPHQIVRQLVKSLTAEAYVRNSKQEQTPT